MIRYNIFIVIYLLWEILSHYLSHRAVTNLTDYLHSNGGSFTWALVQFTRSRRTAKRIRRCFLSSAPTATASQEQQRPQIPVSTEFLLWFLRLSSSPVIKEHQGRQRTRVGGLRTRHRKLCTTEELIKIRANIYSFHRKKNTSMLLKKLLLSVSGDEKLNIKRNIDKS